MEGWTAASERALMMAMKTLLEGKGEPKGLISTVTRFAVSGLMVMLLGLDESLVVLFDGSEVGRIFRVTVVSPFLAGRRSRLVTLSGGPK